jgi:hypothetical protein
VQGEAYLKHVKLNNKHIKWNQKKCTYKYRNNFLYVIVIFNNFGYVTLSDMDGPHMSWSHRWHIRDYWKLECYLRNWAINILHVTMLLGQLYSLWVHTRVDECSIPWCHCRTRCFGDNSHGSWWMVDCGIKMESPFNLPQLLLELHFCSSITNQVLFSLN